MNILAALFVLCGSLVILFAAAGLVKFEDVFLRLHAASKSASFGVVLVLMGAAFHFFDGGTALKMVGVVFLIFLKAPVASHAIARATYHCKEPNLWNRLVVDEWHSPAKTSESEPRSP